MARLFSISPTEPFLLRLIETLLDGALIPGFPTPGDPLAFARAHVFLPTRRACRVFADIMREHYPQSVVLPRLRPLGSLEEADLFFTDDEDTSFAGADLPRDIAQLERQIILTRLILQWMQQTGQSGPLPASSADAAQLARELARLLDMMINEGVPLDALQRLLPAEWQQHWEQAFKFLQIIGVQWPAYLSEQKLLEPAERRRLMMQAEARRLLSQPDTPAIIAGSTGSVPITAEFIAALTAHPRSAIVLPGLDRSLDAHSWDLIASEASVSSHPQAAMAALLRKLKIRREDVAFIGGACMLRDKLASEVMRPAATTDQWSERSFATKDLQNACAGIGLVEAVNESEEALAIALLMRETLETAEATAALVTPDRVLARRVAAELKRFGITIDDSAGMPLPATPAGIFSKLVAQAALKKCEGVNCLALLKNSLCTLKQLPHDITQANSAIERLLTRGVAPSGCDGLLEQFDRPHRTQAARTASAEQKEVARQRLEKFCAALAPLEACLHRPQTQPLSIFAKAHRAAVLAFSEIQASEEEGVLLKKAFGGPELLAFFDALEKAGEQDLLIAGSEYPQLWQAFAGLQAVRSPCNQGARLHIYGLLEARLMQHDRLILGGMNEGIWPPAAETGPWLSRGMLSALKLPTPERRIGLSAHDFSQALGTSDVWLTRARKHGGAPSVPSRFVQRLLSVAGENLRATGEKILQLARHVAFMPETAVAQPVQRPLASPPPAARPRKLSVTKMEALVRDPYAVYAENIIDLKAFEPIGESFDARQRGELVHAILGDFALTLNKGGEVAHVTLQAIAQRHFAPFMTNTEVKNLWWPRFLALIPDIVAFETERRAEAKEIFVEIPGKLSFDLPGGRFDLTARADRIEQKEDGFAIADFKSGAPPATKNIKASFALQLPLQAAMLEQGAFKQARGVSSELFYVGLHALREMEIRAVKEDDVMAFARTTLQEAQKVLAQFDAGEPYRSRADSSYATTSAEYAHLARLGEWGVSAGEVEE